MVSISISENRYPSLLKEIYDPPKCLYTKGNVQLLGKRCISIVGSRNATSYSKWIVENLLDEKLLKLDFCIVSGLARGVDTLVHRRCLELGIPTIAVIAGGIENIYPLSNTSLYYEIANKGLLIAEYEGMAPMKKGMFPRRNRILAGISEATIVVEADIKSGSLLTASYALESNRDVYAIPGYINKNTSHGCNTLIKQGAQVITSKEDFEQILGIEQDQLRMSI